MHTYSYSLLVQSTLGMNKNIPRGFVLTSQVGHLRYIQWHNYYHLSLIGAKSWKETNDWCKRQKLIFFYQKVDIYNRGCTSLHFLAAKHYGSTGKYHKLMARRCFHKNWHCIHLLLSQLRKNIFLVQKKMYLTITRFKWDSSGTQIYVPLQNQNMISEKSPTHYADSNLYSVSW